MKSTSHPITLGPITPDTLLHAVIYLAIFVFLALLATRVLRGVVRATLAHDKDNRIDRTAITFLQQLGTVFIWLFAAVFYINLIPPLRALGVALLASVSIISIIIGMAMQNTLGNVIAGVALLIYRPFKVGDTLRVSAPTGLETGEIESISLGYTILKTADNRRIVLPNSVMAGQTTVNLSLVSTKTMASVPISIGYEMDVERARAIVMRLAQQSPSAQQVVDCPVTNLGPSSVDLALHVWCADAGAASKLQSELLEQIREAFAKEKIEPPYPATNVILKRQEQS
jgi:small-conductance mechanosensitive channel